MGTTKMNPERWARVKEVLDSALGLSPKEREGYLMVACAEDPSLRSEVESLLHAQEQSPDSFMKTGEARSSLPRGTKLGSYEIIELIGYSLKVSKANLLAGDYAPPASYPRTSPPSSTCT